jgi:hypothetical protein
VTHQPTKIAATAARAANARVVRRVMVEIIARHS